MTIIRYRVVRQPPPTGKLLDRIQDVVEASEFLASEDERADSSSVEDESSSEHSREGGTEMSIEKPAVLQTPQKNVTPAVQQRQTAGRKEKLVAASIHKSEVRKFWKEKL